MCICILYYFILWIYKLLLKQRIYLDGLPTPTGVDRAKVTRTVSDLTEWYLRLQYYDVQTLEYRYISKLPMKNERKWSYVKETTSHLQNKLTKNIHLGIATRFSTKCDCLKPIRFHQYTWGLQHFLTFLQEDIGHIKCYWFKINYSFLSSFYIGNITFQIFDRNHITSLDFCETWHSCSTLPADVHEEIWSLSKIWKGR
jgi:hypothetical protein